jgi:serine/threonine protein kinase
MTDVPPDLAAAVVDRYEVRRVVGRGGMATVYLAWDRKHTREVAIKVLRPDLAASIGSERFLKEIQIAARLNHPHVLALHDSGEAGSFLYYVMPYIEGGSLRQRIEAAGRMEPVEALGIAAPVADALSYAHAMGVFHRDIKPENILFSHGHPVVGDFGIAKAISTAGGANLTRTGFPLGTPGYMSPEQAAGLTDLDERSDVYSLAAVVYEMIVGEIPGGWPTEEAVRIGRLLDAAPDHRARLAQAGPTIEGALVRGLAIRHGHRTATPAAFMDDLRGVATPRRQFAEADVQEIVRRAAELEASNPTASGAMTIGGVEQIAAEVGIPVELVRSVARSLDARASTPTPPSPPPRANPFLGAPTRLVFERVVHGEVPDADFPLMVDEVRRVMRNVGQVSQLGRSFAWTMVRSGGGTRSVEVVVTVRAGTSRITVQEPLGNLIGGIFGGIGGGMGGGALGPLLGILLDQGAMGLAPVAALVVVPLWLMTTFATARTAYYYAVRRRSRTLEGLADRLAELARELVSSGGGALPGAQYQALPRG